VWRGAWGGDASTDVEDSSFIREYLGQVLRRMGVECEEAQGGREALTLLGAKEGFDLILLDLKTPVMDGLECLKELREAGLSRRPR
jgi:CheY-like chemotaxis protein